MMITNKKVISLFVGFGVVALIAGAVTWTLYSVYVLRSDGKVIRAIAKGFPAARVGSQTIPYGRFLEVRDTMRVYLASDAAKAAGGSVTSLTPDLEKNIVDRLERDAAMKQLADARHAVVTDDQIHEAFTELLAHTSSSESDINKYLADNYHWTKSDFEQNVIRPSLLETELAKTYPASSTDDSFAAFDAAITDRLKQPDVKIYLRFPDATGAAPTP